MNKKRQLLSAWKNLKNYRKMWVDRIVAERQIKLLMA